MKNREYPEKSVSGKVMYMTEAEETELERREASGELTVLSRHPSKAEIDKTLAFYAPDAIRNGDETI